MTASRKDYRAVAEALNDAVQDAGSNFHGRASVYNAAYRIADAFASTNARFDRARFLEAAIGTRYDEEE